MDISLCNNLARARTYIYSNMIDIIKLTEEMHRYNIYADMHTNCNDDVKLIALTNLMNDTVDKISSLIPKKIEI